MEIENKIIKIMHFYVHPGEKDLHWQKHRYPVSAIPMGSWATGSSSKNNYICTEHYRLLIIP